MEFQKLKNSTYLDYYVIEVWSIVESIQDLKQRLRRTDAYQNITSKKGNNMLISSPEPHEIISSILTHASRLNKLFLASSKRDNEDESSFKFRKQRSEYLRKLLLPKSKKGREIFKAGVRNGLEHFDERLDLMCQGILEKQHQIVNKALLYNITLSSKNVFENWESVVPFKVYTVDSGEYFMVDQNFEVQIINIEIVLKEIDDIAAKCQDWANHLESQNGKKISGPGGLLSTPPNIIREN